MTTMVVVAHEHSSFKEIVRLLHEYGVSALPIVDDQGRLRGIVSEGDLILKEDPRLRDEEERPFEGRGHRQDRERASALVARDLMAREVVTIGPDADIADAARLMHERRLKRLPVVDLEDDVLGVVSRSDLLQIFLRPDAEIAKEIRSVIDRAPTLEAEEINVKVATGVVALRGKVESRSQADALVDAVRSVAGVVDVQDQLACDVNDLAKVDPEYRWDLFAGGGR
jgi:CBS domain-containing protein